MMIKLQPLPYEYDALEPIISEKAMRLHHLSHQQGYVDKLNKTLEVYPEMLGQIGSLYQLISNPKWIPQEIKQSVIDFGGGVWNHAFYWNCLSPNPVRYEDTSRAFQDKVNKTFGSYEDLRDDLILEGTGHFGSGWVWLAETKTGDLRVYSTLNQNTPMMRGHRPILTIDLWEHAYYPDYENGRKEFLEQVIDNLLSWGYASKGK
jgi:Fe-Mn family superoxide dismutase